MSHATNVFPTTSIHSEFCNAHLIHYSECYTVQAPCITLPLLLLPLFVGGRGEGGRCGGHWESQLQVASSVSPEEILQTALGAVCIIMRRLSFLLVFFLSLPSSSFPPLSPSWNTVIPNVYVFVKAFHIVLHTHLLTLVIVHLVLETLSFWMGKKKVADGKTQTNLRASADVKWEEHLSLKAQSVGRGPLGQVERQLNVIMTFFHTHGTHTHTHIQGEKDRGLQCC